MEKGRGAKEGLCLYHVEQLWVCPGKEECELGGLRRRRMFCLIKTSRMWGFGGVGVGVGVGVVMAWLPLRHLDRFQS